MTIQQVLLASSGGLNWVQTSSAILHRSGANDENKFTYIGSSTDADEVILAKYTPLPSFSWIKKLNGAKFDAQIAYDSTGYIYLVTTPTAVNGIILTKFDTSGAVIWSTKYNFLFNYSAIAVNSGGNIYITGAENPSGQTGYVLIFNSGGSLLNQIRITGAATPYNRQLLPRNIKVDSSGNFYVAGKYQSDIGGGSYFNGFVSKFNSSASLVWSTELYDPVPTNAIEHYGLDVDSSGNVYVSGRNGNLSSGYIAKYNSSGTIQWQKTISDMVKIVDLVVTPDNYLYATSESKGAVLKMDTSGNGVYFNSLTPLSFCNIGVYGRNVYLYGQGSATLNSRATSALLPEDGTKTVGAIDSFYNYSAQTLTVSTASYSVRSPTFTITTPTETTSSGGITVSDYLGSSVGPYYF